jgi:hypothetical protein
LLQIILLIMVVGYDGDKRAIFFQFITSSSAHSSLLLDIGLSNFSPSCSQLQWTVVGWWWWWRTSSSCHFWLCFYMIKRAKFSQFITSSSCQSQNWNRFLLSACQFIFQYTYAAYVIWTLQYCFVIEIIVVSQW